jgi:signal transduction histidine kinase
LILASSNAFYQSLNHETFEAFNRIVKEKSVKIRILLSTPLSKRSEDHLDNEQRKNEIKDISNIKNYIQSSFPPIQFDLIDKNSYNNEADGMSILIVDRTEVLCWELNKLYSKNSESTRLAIYSNSRPLVLAYSSIFESLWSETQLYNALKEANIQISNSERRYKEFIDITAHELRTPIHAIMGYSEMALETKDEEPNNNGTRHIKLFEKIVKNANRLNGLLEDFLSFTRIDNNLIVFEKENFNIYDVVKDVVHDLRDVPTIIDRMEEKRKNVIIHLEEQHFEANPIVNVDKIKIYQVLINLINNALKYSEANQSITISMKILENEASNEEGNPYLDFNNISYNKDSTSYLVNTCDEGKHQIKLRNL